MKKNKIKNLVLEIVLTAILLSLFIYLLIEMINLIKDYNLTRELLGNPENFSGTFKYVIPQIIRYAVFCAVSFIGLSISIYFLTCTIIKIFKNPEKKFIHEEEKARRIEAQKQQKIAELEKQLEELKKDDN